MMVLVDTSVWVDFLRRGNSSLTDLLEQGRVCTHQIILGELACGNISGRANFLSLLYDLPACDASTHEEVLTFIDENKAFGKGVGFFDLHLLCSALISSVPLWTLDGNLKKFSRKVGALYSS